MIAACTRKKEWTGPKFSGRLLVVSQLETHSDLIEITPGPNSTYNQTVIVSRVWQAVASPDQTLLLYTTMDGIFLRDLSKGTVKQLAPGVEGGNNCLAWSPDSKRFSFRSDESSHPAARTHLYVSDLDGKKKLIWESWVGGEGLDCDVFWIAPDRLIFDRFLGADPFYEKVGKLELPNTTTLAILGDPVKFVDSDRKWSIDGVCQFGNVAVLTPREKAYPILIAKNLDDLKTLNPSQVCSPCHFAGFAAKSCVPFFLEGDNRTSELFSLNTINWQRQRATHLNQDFGSSKMLINSSARLLIVEDISATLVLVDTESGDSMPFFPKTAGSRGTSGQLQHPIPIAWIEN